MFACGGCEEFRVRLGERLRVRSRELTTSRNFRSHFEQSPFAPLSRNRPRTRTRPRNLLTKCKRSEVGSKCRSGDRSDCFSPAGD
jgi:hypothetical protein